MADAAPWTIKNVDILVRQKAVKAANAAGQTMGEWIAEMVDRVTDPHMAEVIPPGKPEMTEDQRTARMQAVAAMMQGLAAVKTATGRASGRDVVMQEVWALHRGETRRPNGQTNGQTTLQIDAANE